MSSINQAVDQMAAHGLPALPSGHPILDGKIHRFGPKKKAWYVLREIELKTGEKLVGGAFGIWQGDNSNAVSISMDWKDVTPEERAQAEQKQREYESAYAEKKAQLAVNAANRARMQWADALNNPVDSEYLKRKQIEPEKVRATADGVVLVPMIQYLFEGPKLVGLQKIAADGSKMYNKGMDKIGAACLLGALNADSAAIIVAEGYATAGSIRMALGRTVPVMVAFDAGNIIHVARALRSIFPNIKIIFAADDDWVLEQRLAKRLLEDFEVSDAVAVDGQEYKLAAANGDAVLVMASWAKDVNQIAYIDVDVRAGRQIRTFKIENSGIARATAAAKAVGNASIVFPVFADRGENKWSDFNDLHVEQSIEAVAEQLNAVFACDPSVPALPADPANEDGRENFYAENSPPSPEMNGEPGSAAVQSGKGRKKKVIKRSPMFLDQVDYLLEKFVLLYGTNTAWDKENRIQIKITDLRYAFGSDVVKFWLGNGDRKMINFDRLVFDPTEKCNPDTTVNMFRGFSVVPAKGDCSKILDLLSHLCCGDEALTTWVINWIAYPLQHPGAKMESSVIMHGDEGSGKNLFWEKVVRRLYGEYGGVIGNAQIEAQFNEWASQKLFFVADEVVTRNELKQLKGKLKGMISGDEIRVNPKNLPERSEANHLNFVFLSNELKPLELDKTDRRYLVLWTPPKRELSYYKDVADQIYNGGMEAFYYYLLHEVDCGDFNEHTKPLDTKAKARLISLGLSGPERFYREWEAGALPLPFMCCSAMQLYAAFQRWSHLNGERFPPTQTEFGGKVERMAAGAVKRKVVKYDAGGLVKQRTCYLVGEKPEGTALDEWVEAASALFEKDLKKYRHVYDQSEEK